MEIFLLLQIRSASSSATYIFLRTTSLEEFIGVYKNRIVTNFWSWLSIKYRLGQDLQIEGSFIISKLLNYIYV